MSLRITPAASHPSTTTNLTARARSTDASKSTTFSAPSVPGLHDTLRSNLSTNPTTSAPINNASATNVPPHAALPTPASAHPLETRLLHWRATQHELKMEGLKRTFGIAEPVRRGMELGIVRAGEWRAGCLGGSAGVSGDVLEGRDWSIEWEDVFDRAGGEGSGEGAGTGFHAEMEGKLGMGW